MAPPPTKPSLVAGAEDKDHLYFLEHVRPDGDGYALVIPSKDGVSPPKTVRYEQPLPGGNAGPPTAGSERGAKEAPPPPPAAENSRPKRKAPDASPSGEVRGAGAPVEEDTPTQGLEPAWSDAPDIDEDYRFFLQHSRLENGKMVFRTAGCKVTIGDDSDPDEEEKEVEEEEHDVEEAVPSSTDVDTEKEERADSPLPNVSEFKKVKDEVVSEEEEEDAVGKNVGTISDLQIVNDMVYEPMKEVEEGGDKLLKSPVRGTTDLDPLDKKQAGSSKRHLSMPLNASESQGVIWPLHIYERPYSVFKDKLIECLIKPFKQEEYDRYCAMATDRTPMVKERRTRKSVVSYTWKHEMGKSYFDRYPDLAEQFRLQCNNHSNGLALLRGLFFWLQNIELEDQFRPWSSEFKRYRIVPY